MNMPCKEIAATIGALFECAQGDGHIRIRTPFLYPDGDVIDLFCYEDDGVVVLTDMGETLRWLSAQSPAPKRTPKHIRLIAEICKRHGVELDRGEIKINFNPGDNLGMIVTEISQACLRISDLWFTLKYSAVTSVADDVAEFLLERSIAFERNKKLVGRSKREWDLPFVTYTLVRDSFVQLLATGSRGFVHKLVDHAHTAWADLSYFRENGNNRKPVKFVTLFDDTIDVWKEEDYDIFEDVSDIARWSRPDEFANLLIAP